MTLTKEQKKLEDAMFAAMRDAITQALALTSGHKEHARFMLIAMIDTALLGKTVAECIADEGASETFH